MGEHTDQAAGRVKQAAGDLTGDDETKREGEVQENKGKLKEKADDAIDKASDALDDVRDKITGS
jgi:uncharacterized protein YjbJ (UPF0337 family)